MARPNEYDEDVFTDILSRLSKGEMLKDICESAPAKYPGSSTVRRWVFDDLNGCSERYTRAREMGMHEIVDETIRISDNSQNDTTTDREGNPVPDHEWIARSRLRVDTRKWLASKVIPKIYGDRIQQEHTGADGAPLTIAWASTPPKV